MSPVQDVTQSFTPYNIPYRPHSPKKEIRPRNETGNKDAADDLGLAGDWRFMGADFWNIFRRLHSKRR